MAAGGTRGVNGVRLTDEGRIVEVRLKHRALVKFRRNAGLSQAKLAELVDVTQSAVSQWEQARSQPSLLHLREIAKVLRVDLKELVYK